jgi:hypothetical protein
MRPPRGSAAPLIVVLLLLLMLATPTGAHASSVGRDLSAMAGEAQYPAAEVQAWKRDWSRAVHGVRKLRGSARSNLGGVSSDPPGT